MPEQSQHHELLAKLLDGSLTPSEWTEARSIWGDEAIRTMLSGDKRLRNVYQQLSGSDSPRDLTSAIMTRVAHAPAPNRALFWILKYGGLLGTMIFLLGLTTVLIAFSDVGIPTLTFTAPSIDGTLALWGLPVVILIGVGIWRMETA